MFFRTTDFLAEKAWIAVALVIIFVTAYVAIGRQLVEQVPEYRVSVEEMLEGRTGMDVEIDDIRGRWTVFTPVIELSKVRFVQSEADQAVFFARKIALEVDVLSSFAVRELRLRSIVINGFSAVIENEFLAQLESIADKDDLANGVEDKKIAQDSQKQLAGQHAVSSGKDSVLQNHALAEVIFRQRNILLLDSSITFRQPGSPDRVISNINAQLKNIAGNHELAGKVQLGPERQLLQFSVLARGYPLAKDTEIKIYGHLHRGDILAWLPEDIRHKIKLNGLGLNSLLLDTELWATWSEGYFGHIVGKVNADEIGTVLLDHKSVSGQHAGKAITPIRQLSALYAIEPLKLQSYNKGLQFAIADLEFRWADFAWQKSDFFIDVDFSSDIDPLKLKLHASEIDLEPVLAYLLAANSLSPEDSQLIETLKPKGKFKSLSFDYHGFRKNKYRLDAELENMSLNEWRGIPEIKGLSVDLSMTNRIGYMQLKTNNASVKTAKYLRQAITSANLSGPVKWQITKKENKQYNVLVESGVLALDNNDVKGNLEFSFYTSHSEKFSQLSLVADIHQANAGKISAYLPPSLPSGVLSWLDNAIVSGEANGSLVYHGPIGKGAAKPYNHTLQSQVFLNSADIDYLPGEWPKITQSSGRVFIDNGIVDFEISAGKIFQAAASNIIGHIGPEGKNSNRQLKLSADVVGNAADGIRLLKDSVLQHTLNHLADDWIGSGALAAELELLVPLGETAKEAHVNVAMALDDVDINMSNFGLMLSDTHGALHYSTKFGLTCSALNTKLFGNQATINMLPVDIASGVAFKMLFDSKVDAKTLHQWSGQPLLAFFEGKTAYQAEMEVVSKPGQESFTELRVYSNLTGIEINMPSVFYKPADRVSPLLFNMKWQGENTYLFVGRQHVFNSMLMFSDDELLKGELIIGNQLASLPDDNQLYARGFVETINWPDWEQFFKTVEIEYQQQQSNQTAQGMGQGEAEDFFDLIGLIELQTKKFRGFGLELDNVSSKITREGPAWVINTKSKRLAGDIKVPDGDGPLSVNLDYLHWPTPESAQTVKASDYQPIVEGSPVEFPALQIKVMDFKLGEKAFGTWEFVGYPQGQAYRIENLNIQLGDLLLKGKGRWVAGKPYPKTMLRGDISTRNVGDLMKAWGYPATIESKTAQLSYNLSWPHSPLDFDTDYLSGNIQLKIKDGRFLEVEGAASAVRVLGILNFSNLGRRLRLDFTDLFKSGLSYDRIKGPIVIKDGSLAFKDFEIIGPSTHIEAKGTVSYTTRAVDMDLDVSLPFSDNLIPLVTIIAGPVAGGGWFVADRLFGEKLNKAFKMEYKVSNTIDDPEVQLKSRLRN